ncbi:MAG: hypothetical protein WB392_15765, partial [Methanotrichaceae archaeon]
MKMVIDEQGNLYKIDDVSVLKRADTISVYDENGMKFELEEEDAKRLKMTENESGKMIDSLRTRNNCFTMTFPRSYPEAAFARAPEAAFARAPEAAFARA